MNTYIKLFIILFLFSGISCNDWLDVKPGEQATEEDILKTGDGYRSLLLGVYQVMGSANLYGRELSFGFTDCISKQYKLDMGAGITSGQAYVQAGEFNYNHTGVALMIKNIWQTAFNAIANANSLIQKIEFADSNIFRSKEMERNLILGEALACRAMVHFDMLRLFAPPLINDDGRSYVPYVETYPETYAKTIPVKTFLDNVIRDLTKGRELVAEWDTSRIGIGTFITGNARFRNEFSFGTEIYSNPSKWEDFFKGRGYRLNYYAITALLARVYQYAGKHDEALEYAKEVRDLQIKDYYGMIKAFDNDDFSGIQSTNWNAKRDLKIVSNLIFGLYNGNAYEDFSLWTFFKNYSSGSWPTWLIINRDAQKIWNDKNGNDESSYDYRSVYLTFLGDGTYPLSGKYYISEDETTRDRNASIIPAIRATEMHYIIAECYARQGNFTEAQKILNELRRRRGLGSLPAISISNWNEFIDELIRDTRREWIAEGQLFYLYKRLNTPVNFGANVVRPLTRPEYLVPVPEDQRL